MYVFDLGSGRCLTDELTVAARLYPVHISEHSQPAESAAGATNAALAVKRAIWVDRNFADAAASAALTPEEKDTGNAIQLKLGTVCAVELNAER